MPTLFKFTLVNYISLMVIFLLFIIPYDKHNSPLGFFYVIFTGYYFVSGIIALIIQIFMYYKKYSFKYQIINGIYFISYIVILALMLYMSVGQ